MTTSKFTLRRRRAIIFSSAAAAAALAQLILQLLSYVQPRETVLLERARARPYCDFTSRRRWRNLRKGGGR